MKICIVGAFGFDRLDKTTGGQPVKTRQLYYALAEYYGKDNISYIETYGWKSHPLQMLVNSIKESKKNDAIIMLPAHNGVRVFSKLLTYYQKKYGIKTFYDVIGGWLPDVSSKNSSLRKKLKSFDGIWVETVSMKEKLDSQGYKNVEVVPNFKKLPVLQKDALNGAYQTPYPVCTFSRVTEKKGIEDAIKAVAEINQRAGKIVYQLDVYGPIDDTYRDRFEGVLAEHIDCVRYCGVVSPEQSVQTLKKYFALIFPTHFYTEGIPGTLIDAYSAGVPVIAAMWKNHRDIFLDGVTGWGYEFGNYVELVKVLEKAAKNNKEFIAMKEQCIAEAVKYQPEFVMNMIDKLLGE